MEGFTTESHKKIERLLKEPLPGPPAQYKMAPVERHGQPTDRQTRRAGVMVLLYSHQQRLQTILIRRTVYDGVHSGQISFPGGKMETDDDNLSDTALRETHEEIGISAQSIRIMGLLTPLYIPVSNNLVQPVLGALIDRPHLIREPKEVDRIYEISIDELLQPGALIQNESIRENNRHIKAPFYKYNGLQIWGATAMILSEFLELYRKSLF